MDITAFDPKKHQPVKVGVLENDIFYKKCNKRHFMNIVQGYGIQEEVIQRLVGLRCKKVIIKTKDDVLESSLGDWVNAKIMNFGHGNQRFLPAKYMKGRGTVGNSEVASKSGQPQTKKAKVSKPGEKACTETQQDMFGGQTRITGASR